MPSTVLDYRRQPPTEDVSVWDDIADGIMDAVHRPLNQVFLAINTAILLLCVGLGVHSSSQINAWLGGPNHANSTLDLLSYAMSPHANTKATPVLNALLGSPEHVGPAIVQWLVDSGDAASNVAEAFFGQGTIAGFVANFLLSPTIFPIGESIGRITTYLEQQVRPEARRYYDYCNTHRTNCYWWWNPNTGQQEWKCQCPSPNATDTIVTSVATASSMLRGIANNIRFGYPNMTNYTSIWGNAVETGALSSGLLRLNDLVQWTTAQGQLSAWNTAGAACSNFVQSLRAVNWAGSWTNSDGSTHPWDINKNIRDITQGMDRVCHLAGDLPATDAPTAAPPPSFGEMEERQSANVMLGHQQLQDPAPAVPSASTAAPIPPPPPATPDPAPVAPPAPAAESRLTPIQHTLITMCVIVLPCLAVLGVAIRCCITRCLKVSSTDDANTGSSDLFDELMRPRHLTLIALNTLMVIVIASFAILAGVKINGVAPLQDIVGLRPPAEKGGSPELVLNGVAYTPEHLAHQLVRDFLISGAQDGQPTFLGGPVNGAFPAMLAQLMSGLKLQPWGTRAANLLTYAERSFNFSAKNFKNDRYAVEGFFETVVSAIKGAAYDTMYGTTLATPNSIDPDTAAFSGDLFDLAALSPWLITQASSGPWRELAAQACPGFAANIKKVQWWGSFVTSDGATHTWNAADAFDAVSWVVGRLCKDLGSAPPSGVAPVPSTAPPVVTTTTTGTTASTTTTTTGMPSSGNGSTTTTSASVTTSTPPPTTTRAPTSTFQATYAVGSVPTAAQIEASVRVLLTRLGGSAAATANASFNVTIVSTTQDATTQQVAVVFTIVATNTDISGQAIAASVAGFVAAAPPQEAALALGASNFAPVEPSTTAPSIAPLEPVPIGLIAGVAAGCVVLVVAIVALVLKSRATGGAAMAAAEAAAQGELLTLNPTSTPASRTRYEQAL